jgi:hypothetical protein
MPTELDYLELKASLMDSDSTAIVSTGHNAFQVLPVFMYGQKPLIEVDNKFEEATAVKGFLRFEKTPQTRAAQV